MLARAGLALGVLDAGELSRELLQPCADLDRACPHRPGPLGQGAQECDLLGYRLVALLELRHVSEK